MIKNLLDTLPQGSVIDPDEAERWAQGIAKWHGDRIGFHVSRLSGFGGSESGAVARGVNGKPVAGFSSLEKIVEHKLLKRLPEFQNHHMTRGTELEELARLAFMYRYQAARDMAAIDAIGKTPPNERFPWLIGNQDDVVLINGKRLMNDYKVPNTFTEEIDEDYVYQLHHYGLQARFASVPLDGYLLTKLDLAPELAQSLVTKFPLMTEQEQHQMARTIAMADVPGMRVVSFGVPVDRNISIDILDACSFAWDEYVLKGVVPRPETKPEVTLAEADMTRLDQLRSQFLMTKGGISHLETTLKGVQKEIAGLLEGVDLEKNALPKGPVNIKAKGLDNKQLVQEALERGAAEDELKADQQAYSVMALIEEIKRLDGDPEAEHLYEKKLDAKKAQSYLEAAGVDLSAFQQEGLSILLSRTKADKPLIQSVEDEAGEVLGRWFDSHLEEDCTPYDDNLELIQGLEQHGSHGTSGTPAHHDISDEDDADLDNDYPKKNSAGMR